MVKYLDLSREGATALQYKYAQIIRAIWHEREDEVSESQGINPLQSPDDFSCVVRNLSWVVVHPPPLSAFTRYFTVMCCDSNPDVMCY